MCSSFRFLFNFCCGIFIIVILVFPSAAGQHIVAVERGRTARLVASGHPCSGCVAGGHLLSRECSDAHPRHCNT